LSRQVEELSKRIESLLSGQPPADLHEVVSGFAAEDARALAERLVELARAHADWRRNLVQTAKLAEVGLAMAELVHELRQPLSGISGFAQLLSGDPQGRDAREWIHELLLQTTRMEQLLERMRRFLKPSDEELSASTEPSVAVRETLAIFPKLPPGLELETRLEPHLPCVQAEQHRLVQVLSNLVSNARDAMAGLEQGKVLVSASLEKGLVEIRVADQGTGIPPELQPRLFEPFATSKGENGTGLGLYISREILKPWGAELALADAPEGFRTAFVVRLRPAARAEPVAASTGGETERKLASLIAEMRARTEAVAFRRRVLVVEDEPPLRRAFKVLLAADPELEVLDAEDGTRALDVISREGVQVAVVDKNLPGIAGLDLLRRVRKAVALEAVLVTGFPTAPSAIEALELGVADYLLKPLERVELLRERVREAMERSRWRHLESTLSPHLRPWAERALASMPSSRPSARPELEQALENLARRPEGPGRVMVIGTRSLVEQLALAGHQAERFVAPAKAAAALAGEDCDVLVLGEELEKGQAMALLKQARSARWPSQVLWAAPLPDFYSALEVLRAGAGGVLTAESQATSRVAQAIALRRQHVRLRALKGAFESLGVLPEPRTKSIVDGR